MARRGRHPHNRLTDLMIRRAKPGRHVDGNGLHLYVRSNGYRSWVHRVTIGDARHDLGLGPYPLVSLAEARALAVQNLATIRSGGDPRSVNTRKRVPTLRQVVEAVIETRRSNWKHPATEQDFRRMFDVHVFPTLADRSVDAIELPDMLDVLNPIWGPRGSQGYTLRQHLSAVMQYAVAHGHRPDDPAAKAKNVLPKVTAAPVHHASLPHRRTSAAMSAIRVSAADEAVKLFVVFTVLTAARFSEAAEAVWPEIVDDDAVWVLPPGRMKARRQHRVPLSRQALEILRVARALAPTSRYVFPVRRRDGSLCCVPPAPVTRLLRRLELVDEQQRPVVMHGFRATFRVWAMEAEASFEVCEAALAHVQSDQTVSAYARSDLFGRRRVLMQQWADYVLPGGWS